MIHVKNLTSGYGKKIVLKDINITFESGLIYGILGPNGSGKTTFLRNLSGILRPFNGDVLLDGKNINELAHREIAKIMAVVIPQEQLAFNYKVIDIVKMGRAPYLKWYQFEEKKDEEIVEKVLVETDLMLKRDNYYNELSSGERQRVEIARAIAQEPGWLLLDEPTAHLDLAHQLRIMSLIKKLNLEKKVSVLGVFHDINLAALFCDRLLLMKNGEICIEGGVKEVLSYENIRNVFGVEVDLRKIENNIQVGLKLL